MAWAVATGKPAKVIAADSNKPDMMYASSDGKYLVSGYGTSVRMWRVGWGIVATPTVTTATDEDIFALKKADRRRLRNSCPQNQVGWDFLSPLDTVYDGSDDDDSGDGDSGSDEDDSDSSSKEDSDSHDDDGGTDGDSGDNDDSDDDDNSSDDDNGCDAMRQQLKEVIIHTVP